MSLDYYDRENSQCCTGSMKSVNDEIVLQGTLDYCDIVGSADWCEPATEITWEGTANLFYDPCWYDSAPTITVTATVNLDGSVDWLVEEGTACLNFEATGGTCDGIDKSGIDFVMCESTAGIACFEQSLSTCSCFGTDPCSIVSCHYGLPCEDLALGDGYCVNDDSVKIHAQISLVNGNCCDVAAPIGTVDCVDMETIVDEAIARACIAGTDEDKLTTIAEWYAIDCGFECADLLDCATNILGRELTADEKKTLEVNSGCAAKASGLSDPQNEETDGTEGNLENVDCPEEDPAKPNPHHPKPVELDTGHKIEVDTDLVVPMLGRDFVVQRYYSSKDRVSSNLVGIQWVLTPFQYLHFETADEVQAWCGTPAPRHVSFKRSNPNDPWYPDGPATQYLDDVSSGTYYRLTEPGAWEMDFYGPNEALAGFLHQTRDLYGNVHTYDYITYGGGVVRLSAVYLNGTASTGSEQSEAEVHFEWYLDNSLPGSNGKLKEIRAVRRDSTGELVLTDRVVYTYRTTGDGNDGDVGDVGNLIQVAKYTGVDKMPNAGEDPFRVQITQYRYHDGEPGTGDPRLVVDGESYDLKSVFLPEQIEFYAQQLNASVTTIDPDAVPDAATTLMTLPDSATATTGIPVIDMASKIVSYTATGEVDYQFLQSSCGCGGGNAQGVKEEFDYYDHTGIRTVRVKEWLYDEVADDYTVPHRTVYYDVGPPNGSTSVPYLINKAVQDPGATHDEWVWHYWFDAERNLERIVTPSALNSYTPGDAGPAPSYTASSTSGLVHGFVYSSDNYLTHMGVREGDSSNMSTFTVTQEITYDTTRAWLPVTIERFRDETSTAANDVETTTLSYGFKPATGSHVDSIAWRMTSVEAELESENGPASVMTYVSYDLFDEDGTRYWSRAKDGALTYREFDDSHGHLTLRRDNSATTGLPSSVGNTNPLDTSGWTGRNADGGDLTTTWAYDLLGRMVNRLAPGGVNSYIVREMQAEPLGRDGIYFYVETALPHALGGISSPTAFTGPAITTWYNADNDSVRTSGFGLSTTGYDPLSAQYTLDGTEYSRTITSHSLSGLTDEVEEWWLISEGLSYTTQYEYDELGRPVTTVNDVGTYTLREYDVLDRATKVSVGTSEANAVTVSETTYDGGDVGNSNVTLSRLHADDSTVRDTVHRYDFRDRRTETDHPEQPWERLEYDNLDRVVERKLVDNGGNAELVLQRDYSQRGLKYVDRIAIDPLSPTSFLETHCWYDEVGRKIAEWKPNAPGTKQTIDGLGRPSVAWITDRRSDASPGTSGTYADAQSVSDDVVYERIDYTYDATSGKSEMVKTSNRRHDDLFAWGDLTTGSHDPVITFRGWIYDDAYRVSKEVEFGTNDETNDIFANGSTPSLGSLSGNEIVITYGYGPRGVVETITKPEGQVTKTQHDDLNRQAVVIENYSDAAGTWDTDRWTVSGLSHAETDTDRATSYVYDGNGNVILLTAHIPVDPSGEAIQSTQYVYGVTKSVGGSDINSNDLLHKIHYPQEDGASKGEPGTTAEFTVTHQYNRLGEIIEVVDQNETEHSYARDGLGRVTKDEVSFPAVTDIDETIDELAMSFDDAGRLDTVTSKDGTTVVNEIKFHYNGLWQITEVEQEAQGSVDAQTPSVDYTYSTASVGSGNYSRVEKMVYPSGTPGSSGPAELTYEYQNLQGLGDHLISRISKLDLDGTDVAMYRRLGLTRTALVDYGSGPDIQLDRQVAVDGTRTTGAYYGWDRFGRVKLHSWVDGDFTTGTGGLPNKPQIVALEYRYDKNSNRTHRLDARPGDKRRYNRSFVYTYDELDRLTQADRGSWNGSSIVPETGGGSQKWTLDMLGNWDLAEQDPNGDSPLDYEGSDDREHNFANEITERVVTGSGTLDHTNDAAGNLRTMDRSAALTDTYTHDAWNRLVEVTDTNGDVGQYEYNGLHWRTRKIADTGVAPDGVLDEERRFFYSSNWQMVEEQIDDSYTPQGSFSADTVAQHVWGIRYIDDIVMRRTFEPGQSGSVAEFLPLTDAQFSMVATVDSAGALVELVSYDAYGHARHHWKEDLNGDGAYNGTDDTIALGSWLKSLGQAGYNVDADLDRSGTVDAADIALGSSSHLLALPSGWISYPGTGGPGSVVGFQGYMFDAERTQGLARFRSYDPALGRWLERDPSLYRDGLLLYQFVAGGPARFTDPFGLKAYSPTAIGECGDCEPGDAFDENRRFAGFRQEPWGFSPDWEAEAEAWMNNLSDFQDIMAMLNFLKSSGGVYSAALRMNETQFRKYIADQIKEALSDVPTNLLNERYADEEAQMRLVKQFIGLRQEHGHTMYVAITFDACEPCTKVRRHWWTLGFTCTRTETGWPTRHLRFFECHGRDQSAVPGLQHSNHRLTAPEIIDCLNDAQLEDIKSKRFHKPHGG